MEISNEQDLYMAVGEIRADVRTLVTRGNIAEERLNTLEKTVERRTYLGAGVMAFAFLLVDPKQWSTWFSVLRSFF